MSKAQAWKIISSFHSNRPKTNCHHLVFPCSKFPRLKSFLWVPYL